MSVADAPVRRFEALPEPDEPALLTPRELEVLSDVADGLTNKEIAGHLGISLHTVKFHVESLMRKLVVSSRAEAVSKSMRLKLLGNRHPDVAASLTALAYMRGSFAGSSPLRRAVSWIFGSHR